MVPVVRTLVGHRRRRRTQPVGREDQGPLEEREEKAVVLTDKVCLIPGDKPVVRVEDAPGNARRIFTGVDIRATVEDVWGVMTDYSNLPKVVPNLRENEIIHHLDNGGARLWQIGRSSWRIFGRDFFFQAGTTLDVKLHPTGMCNSGVTAAGQRLDASQMSSDEVRAYGKGLKLVRDVFPRPFSLAADGVPVRDITMQNVLGARSDFVHYQGVWRLQPLEGCAQPDEDMMRLTFAVEVEPHWFLPVAPVEGRIATALVENMEAIRDHVESEMQTRRSARRAPSQPAEPTPQGGLAARLAAAPPGGGERTLWNQAAEWLGERLPFSLECLPQSRWGPAAAARSRRRRGAFAGAGWVSLRGLRGRGELRRRVRLARLARPPGPGVALPGAAALEEGSASCHPRPLLCVGPLPRADEPEASSDRVCRLLAAAWDVA